MTALQLYGPSAIKYHCPVPQVIVLAGPCGAGRSTLARQLMRDFSDKLMQAPLLTTR